MIRDNNVSTLQHTKLLTNKQNTYIHSICLSKSSLSILNRLLIILKRPFSLRTSRSHKAPVPSCIIVCIIVKMLIRTSYVVLTSHAARRISHIITRRYSWRTDTHIHHHSFTIIIYPIHNQPGYWHAGSQILHTFVSSTITCKPLMDKHDTHTTHVVPITPSQLKSSPQFWLQCCYAVERMIWRIRRYWS